MITAGSFWLFRGGESRRHLHRPSPRGLENGSVLYCNPGSYGEHGVWVGRKVDGVGMSDVSDPAGSLPGELRGCEETLGFANKVSSASCDS